MGPQQSSPAPLPSFLSVSYPTEMRALHGVVSPRQGRVRGCGEVLASPKTLREVSHYVSVFLTSNRGGHLGRDSQNHRSDVLWCRVVP